MYILIFNESSYKKEKLSRRKLTNQRIGKQLKDKINYVHTLLGKPQKNVLLLMAGPLRKK